MAVGDRQEASSSSSTTSSRCSYHVFLSFKRNDIRKSFIDHLHTALVHAGIHTFIYDELERGENIKSELQKAIQQSRISIIVFSQNYASSRRCLDELVKILIQRRTSVGHKVLAIYYDVHPFQVREQTGSFAEAFSKHEEQFKAEETGEKMEKGWMEKMADWRAALREVADLEGMVLQNQADGYESNFIQDVVKNIRSKLNRMALNVARYPVGIDFRAKSINTWLQDQSTGVVIGVICGMGGIGKTTIAKAVYNLNFDRFDGSSFLANIRENSEQPNGLVRLQRQLLSDILKGRKEKIYNVDEGITKIKDAICCKRVLVILDDVDQAEQIDAVFGMRDWFYPGSKIVITTRNERLLRAHEVCKMYIVKELDDDESLKLFSWHAFGQDHPVESYTEHSKSVIKHCGGLPLALQVLGSSLSGRSVEIWKSTLKKLEVISDNNIQKKLEISYKSLEDDHDRNLFLHIACFFVGKDRDYVVKVLDECSFFTIVGLENLEDRCLLYLDIGNKLMMHQLLRDMGREIVRQESPKEAGRRSRLWHHKDSFTVLTEKTGTETIQGLVFDMRMLKEDKSSRTIIDVNIRKRKYYHDTPGNLMLSRQVEEDLKVDAFAMMHNLRLLQLNYVKFNGGYKEFPKMLRWLCWRGFPLEFIPNEISLEGLVVLDMCNSSLKELWKGTKILELLKILNLSYSQSLIKTPDFSQLPSLEKLILKNCVSLVKVHESIGDLRRLLVLNLRGCKSLRKLPKRICQVKSLREIILSGCSKLERLPTEFEKLDSLTVLHADRTFIRQLHSTLREGNSWHKIFWSRVSKPIKSLGVSWSLPRSLVRLSLWDCNLSDDVIPTDLSSLSMLARLDLGTNPMGSLPESIKHLSTLQILRLDFCTNLKSLPELPLNLRGLNAGSCTSLERITNLPNHGSSLNLELFDCPNLIEVQGKFKLEPIGNTPANMINDLGLINLESFENIEVEMHNQLTHMEQKGPPQALYEFGIFSTFLPGNEVPELFNHRHTGSSISFTVPSLFNLKMQGLSVCVLYALLKRHRNWVSEDLTLKINNETTGQKWIYEPMCFGIPEANEDMLWLSHWKFGKELKGGNKMNVSVDMPRFQVKQCGVHLVYSNLEEDDTQTPSDGVMIQQNTYSAYQKFFDRDLSAYQMSTGAFLLTNHESFFDQRCSGNEWVHNDLMEITWLTDDEEEDEDEDED